MIKKGEALSLPNDRKTETVKRVIYELVEI